MEIRVRNVSKNYYSDGKKIEALADVDLTIPSNRIFTLLGPSGCGKTTLLRCIVGLESPDAGEIAIGDEVVFSAERGIFVPPDRRGLGMVFQTYAIWPHMNVFDNVAYPLQARNESQGGDQSARSQRRSTSCSSTASRSVRPQSSAAASSSASPWPGPWWPSRR